MADVLRILLLSTFFADGKVRHFWQTPLFALHGSTPLLTIKLGPVQDRPSQEDHSVIASAFVSLCVGHAVWEGLGPLPIIVRLHLSRMERRCSQWVGSASLLRHRVLACPCCSHVCRVDTRTLPVELRFA